MSDLHVIGWDIDKCDGRAYRLWYCGKRATKHSKSMRTQASPQIVIQRTPLITEAIKFDTFIEAYDIYNNTKIRRGGQAYIRYFTEQEIFKIVLEGG
jgi:hypothetical protein